MRYKHTLFTLGAELRFLNLAEERLVVGRAMLALNLPESIQAQQWQIVCCMAEEVACKEERWR